MSAQPFYVRHAISIYKPNGGTIHFRRHPSGPTEVISSGPIGQEDFLIDVFDCPLSAMVAALHFQANLAAKKGLL